MSRCPQCGEHPWSEGGLFKAIDDRVAVTLKRGFSGCVGTESRASAVQVAREYAIRTVSALYFIDFSNPDVATRLCPELAPESLQRMAKDDLEKMAASLSYCAQCQAFASRQFEDDDWLELRSPGCDCPNRPSCGHSSASHERLYPDGDRSEINGADRGPGKNGRRESTILFWKYLRRGVLAEFFLSYAELFAAPRAKVDAALARLPDYECELREQVQTDLGNPEQAVHDSSAPLRFCLGCEVECSVDDAWQRGSVIQIGYREFGWPEGKRAPYQVKLDNGATCYALQDNDRYIRKALVFQPGQRVQLAGLQQAALNGQSGTVVPFASDSVRSEMAASGRVPVVLDSGGAKKSIKEINLQLLSEEQEYGSGLSDLGALVAAVAQREVLPVAIETSDLKKATKGRRHIACIECQSEDAHAYLGVSHPHMLNLVCLPCFTRFAAESGIPPNSEDVERFIDFTCVSAVDACRRIASGGA